MVRPRAGGAAVTWRHSADGLYLPLVLTLALAAAVLALSWYGYRAVTEWRRSTAALIDRTTHERADLLVTALMRDMRGAQALILANRDSGDYATQALADFSYEVASAFARYSYPESFFGWRRSDGELVFFNRARRVPSWADGPARPGSYPVVLAWNPQIRRLLLDRILQDAEARLTYARFRIELAGTRYEVIARLGYSDVYREQLESITGFTVNLAWVRERYFGDLVSEISRVAQTTTTLDYAILDEAGTVVTGVARDEMAARRPFPLQFFDPNTVERDGEENTPPMWEARVSAARDPMLVWATSGEDITLLAIVAAAVAVAISFLLAAYSFRTRASLAAMRAEFVSVATHGLKTPLATIRAASETMVRGPLSGAELTEYAHLLLKESRRVTRLVDNLLAYARIIDVRDLYHFERLAPAELIEESLRGFEPQLTESGFTVTTDVPHDLPLVRGDRTSLRLALDNLIDNAIRYSGSNRAMRISARAGASRVVIEVADEGPGIPPDEIEAVTRRFIRGRRAQTQGSGLGLAIVMRVTADHDGIFQLESDVGTGTRARLEVPLYEVEP